MERIVVKDIVSAVKGRLVCGDQETAVTRVVTDSREAGEGSLFVPIIGERVDAHRFIPEVMEAGAAAVFSSDPEIRPERGACIYVEDTLEALQHLAGWYRSRFDIPVIGVTGSVGKTTTKEMISTVLSTRYHVLKTIGNLNSQIGVALMMFHLDRDVQMAVFEMGISMPGEMARLVEIAKPQTVVITNIGVSHIGNLGSRGNIMREKGHIVKYAGTSHGGRIYICGNGDLKELAGHCIPYEVCEKECETVFYGTGEDCAVRALDIQVDEEGQNFLYEGISPTESGRVRLSVLGSHNVNNAVIALALGQQFGISLENGARALERYRPFAMRGERKDCHGYHIIDDTYNASPDSINSNIDALFDYDAGREAGKKIAVLGDVLELGDQSEELHRGIGQFIAKEAENGKKLSYVVTVGEGAGYICSQVEEQTDIPTKRCRNNSEAADFVKQIAGKGDWILIKGSRGMKMDEVVSQVMR